jgi:hypothetical protein
MLSHHSGHVLIEATVRQLLDHKAGLIGALIGASGPRSRVSSPSSGKRSPEPYASHQLSFD